MVQTLTQPETEILLLELPKTLANICPDFVVELRLRSVSVGEVETYIPHLKM